MLHPARNEAVPTRGKHLGCTIYRHFKLALQHKTALLVWVLVQWQPATRCHLQKIDGVVLGMNELATKARGYFLGYNVVESVKVHGGGFGVKI
jgi:hypothetical protein